MDCITIQHEDPDLQLKHYKQKWKVVITWNRFTSALRDAVLLYFENQKDEYFERFSVVPWRKIFLAAVPFICYLLLFKNYNILRAATGMVTLIPPSVTFLPWLEELVFRCQPHRILASYANPLLDVLAAFPYLLHFPLPVLFVVYLYVTPRRRRDIFPFLWLAGWVNFSTVLFQFFFPTAPPWFADTAKFDAEGNLIDVGPPEAGFIRVDRMMGFPLFHNIYAHAPHKFGAFPSLHVAWPVVVLVSRPWVSTRFAIGHVIWISWAAMYSNHHYGVDALMGIVIVFVVSFLTSRLYSPFHNHTIEAAVLPVSMDAESAAARDLKAGSGAASSVDDYLSSGGSLGKRPSNYWSESIMTRLINSAECLYV